MLQNMNNYQKTYTENSTMSKAKNTKLTKQRYLSNNKMK